jgi:hypothetical protein
MTHQEKRIEAAAAAIANARGGRNGVPVVSNVLEMLRRVAPTLYAEVFEDAKAALAAADGVAGTAEELLGNVLAAYDKASGETCDELCWATFNAEARMASVREYVTKPSTPPAA